MKYLSITEGRAARGLRLVLSAGVPGPWSESVKALFRLRQIPHVVVGQDPMGENEELVAWTGIRNAPIVVVDDDPPLSSWLDILMLAERIGSGPAMLPACSPERALCLGFLAEVAGPCGFGWNARLWMMAKIFGSEPTSESSAHQRSMLRQYGVSAAAVAAAPGRAADLLQALTAQLSVQRERGCRFLIGVQLTALDIYWSCFSQLVAPLPHELCPMPEYVRAFYGDPPPTVLAALSPALIAHRNHIYEHHIGLPLEF